MRFKITGTEDKTRGRLYRVKVETLEHELLLTWHSLERIAVWGLNAEQVLDTCCFLKKS